MHAQGSKAPKCLTSTPISQTLPRGETDLHGIFLPRVADYTRSRCRHPVAQLLLSREDL